MRSIFRPWIAAVALTVAAASPALCAEPSPLAEGRLLFEQKCATCHTIERSLAVKADRAGWEGTIKRMMTKGAAIEPAQVGPIVGYLTAKSAFETKCNTCHDLQRPLTAIKNPEQWQASVKLMAAKQAGSITEADAGAIALYLSLVTPVKPAPPAAK